MAELIFHPRAAEDAGEIAAGYSSVSKKLADRFWAELDAAIDKITAFPERHHFDPSGLRRANLKAFPYHILFEVRLDCIYVLVIRHHRRNPSFGMRRK